MFVSRILLGTPTPYKKKEKVIKNELTLYITDS